MQHVLMNLMALCGIMCFRDIVAGSANEDSLNNFYDVPVVQNINNSSMQVSSS
jgi:hypothetical protein